MFYFTVSNSFLLLSIISLSRANNVTIEKEDSG